MTLLLVSVRDAAEAALALAAGVDVIDVKEPRAGSLGRAERSVLNQIVQTAAGCRPLSAALGELLEPRPAGLLQSLPRVQYAKFGLAGCAATPDWPRLWRRALAELPGSTAAVAVVYADEEAAGAPPAAEIVRYGEQFGCQAVLVDTFNKNGRGLCATWSPKQIDEWVDQIHARQMSAALAGQLSAGDVKQLLSLDWSSAPPDFIAVRGAVCGAARDSAICEARLAELAQLFAGRPAKANA